jgi:branched-subunit amino acid aminotransferase/4-amino-4-deoxychorismate lyase
LRAVGGLFLYALQADGPEPLAAPAHARTLHDVDLPEGIYEGLRTFGRRRFLLLERHLERAQRSMQLLGWRTPLDQALVRRGLDAALRRVPWDDVSVRLDVFEEPIDVLGACTRHLLVLAPFAPVAAEVLARGVAVGIARGKARQTPRVKRNEWIARRRGTGPGDAGFYEHLLLDERERILEGTSCNIFCARGETLFTAPDEVLGGIQRGVFLDLAAAEGIPARLEACALAEVEALDEMFLTSSSRAAVPIVAVEHRRVGRGVPGPIWRRLLDRYAALAAAEARPAL